MARCEKRMTGKHVATNRRSRANECGAMLVEFTIAAAVFLAVMFAIIEFGRALWTHNALADAARRGARYAVNQSASNTAAVKNVVVYGDPAGGTSPLVHNLTTNNVAVQYANFGLDQGSVSVSIVNYQFQFVVPLIGTTLNMSNYNTTLTAENAGLVPPNL
ncbi:MAG: TadE/TadG family type IV pilus assembly protein [Pyrinomonadaceae bacterium]